MDYTFIRAVFGALVLLGLIVGWLISLPTMWKYNKTLAVLGLFLFLFLIPQMIFYFSYQDQLTKRELRIMRFANAAAMINLLDMLNPIFK